MPPAPCPHAARVAAQLGDPAARLDSDLAAHLPGCEACRGAVAGAVRAWPVARNEFSSSSLVLWLTDPAAAPTVVTALQAGALAEGRADALELGPHLLLDRIDAGGMGEVFRAWHRVLLREDAVKMLRTELAADPELARRFFREAEAAARLQHPNVVTVYTADQIAGRYFLAMELVSGTDLDKLVRSGGPLPVGTACEYARQAAEGLEHAFRAGLVHRDVKPSNLLVTADRRTVKVADFGLARALDPDGTSALTQARTVIGTVDFMAPEQAADSHAADARSDVYALGCTLYYLLTGQPPFPGGGWRERMNRHATAPPPLVRAVRPKVPAAVEAVVLKCMAKRPDDRYQTPGELAAALEAVLPPGSDVSTRREGAPVGAASAPVGWKRIWLGAGALVLVVIGVGAVIVAGRTPEGRVPVDGPAPAPAPVKADPGGSAAVAVAEGIPVPQTKGPAPWKFSVTCWSGHRQPVQAVAFLPDGSVQAGRALPPVADQPAQLLWENWAPTGGGTPTRRERTPVGPGAPDTPLLVAADGCYTSRFSRYDPTTLKPLAALSADVSGFDRGRSPSVFALAASADATTLVGDATGETGGKRLVVRWDAKTRAVRGGWAVTTRDLLRDVSADLTGNAVATGTVEGRVLRFAAGSDSPREWTAPSGADTKPDAIWSVAISSDGQTVYTGHQSNRVLVWNATRDTPALELPVGVWTPNRLVVSPDGRWLAAVGAGVRVWDLRTDPPKGFTLAPDLSTDLNRVAFNSDSTRLAVTGKLGVVWVWDLEK